MPAMPKVHAMTLVVAVIAFLIALVIYHKVFR